MKKKSYKTTCSYCGVGCGIIVKSNSENDIEVEGDVDHPVNKGMLCSKGRNLHHVVKDTSDRILYPEMRWSRNHPLERVTWDAAMSRAAAVFKSLINKYGPDSVGFYVSGQCLTEEYYLANKLVKGFIGTNNIDTNSRLCMSSAVAGYVKTFGEDSVPISYDDIELADCFLIAGANPAWCHPILFRRLEQHKVDNPEVKIIVVDPRETPTCSIADLHLQINPGTDIYLFHAIAVHLLATKQIDEDFIENHTEGFWEYREQLASISIFDVAKICDISQEEIVLAANYIGQAKGFISMWAMGLNQSVIGVNKNLALLNLSLLTGHVGKPGSGPFSLTGQPNAMGGREVGGMASLLAVHKDQNNPEHRKDVARFWGVDDIPSKPGLTATQMFDALASGDLKAVWIICTNPSVSLPNSRKVERALKNARFVVVQDISHKSDTTKYGDIVLPAAGWLEKEGTMTNSDRRISYLSKVIEPPGEAKPDAEILCLFANAMGYKGFDYNNSTEVYDEHCRMTKGTNIDISGLNYERLKNEGTFQWPVPYEDHEGTVRLFEDKKFYTPTRKARFNRSSVIANQSEPLSSDFPLVLTTGRLRDQWHTMTKTGKVNTLLTHQDVPFLEIHPIDARERNLEENDLAVIKNERGEVRVKTKVTSVIKRGVVFLPMHWGKILNKGFGRANNLTSDVYDPISKEPDFKYSAVQVTKYKKPFQKVCVIGAGAAAYRFIQSYRVSNPNDEIQVFSLEEFPFYNRVLLPEYVSEFLDWDQLLKLKNGELNKLNISLHTKTKIDKIDRKNRLITDSNGETHGYDILVAATGARPFVPKDVPIHLPGVFTMRNRFDADGLKQYLKDTNLPVERQHVLIIGGGLLGLELSAALRHVGVNITIVQRASRLMERQLDNIASKLLGEEVMDRGIQIHFDNEVDTIFQNEENKGLIATLKSGKIISCNAAVYAIGTIPNIDILKNNGIKCGRGVEVNEYLQTSDSNIYAIGEIAEFKKRSYGITAAAEQQADILAKSLNGDLSCIYKGSVLMNILKFDNFSLCSIGDVNFPKDDNSVEEVIFTDLSKRYYKKCIVRNDRLIGAILIGDKAEFAEFKALIENKIELSTKRNELLRSQNQQEPVLGKLVCSCNHVGEGNLEKHIKNGCESFNALCTTTGAGLGCGSCKPEIKSIFDKVNLQIDNAIV